MHPPECTEQLGRDPSKNGSSKSLVLKTFSGGGTLWDFWDTPPLWEPVDPVVADPVRQDNDKRNDIQIYTEIPY